MNLLQSVAKMLKSLKFMSQLYCNRWSGIADYLTFLRRFPVILEIPMCSVALVCTDRAKICFKSYIGKERKCSFENGLAEKSKSLANLK